MSIVYRALLSFPLLTLTCPNATLGTSNGGDSVNSKLYVGNLPFSTTDQELQDLFASHGTVISAKVITDRYTGRSRGFGFVEMAAAEEAQHAITAFNGTELGSRTLVVNEARPQARKPSYDDTGRENSRPSMTSVARAQNTMITPESREESGPASS